MEGLAGPRLPVLADQAPEGGSIHRNGQPLGREPRGVRLRAHALSSLTATYRLTLDGGRKAFLKIKASDSPFEARLIKHRFQLEKTCLEVFKGLAVPEAVPIELADLPFLRKGQRLAWDLSLTDTGYIVESFEGARFHDHVRPAAPAKMIGVWLFCLEQFVAFRRHQILYTDIKCSNIVATHDPWRIVIVDFDRVVPLVGGRYHYRNFGATAGFDPPEVRTSNRRMTEAACVYQLGILLLHFLTRGINAQLEDQKLGLPKLSQILRRQRIDPLIDLFRRSIADDPRRRPQSFEDVLQEVHRMRIPPQSLDTWAELRAPSATKLAAVELALPTPPARARRRTR